MLLALLQVKLMLLQKFIVVRSNRSIVLYYKLLMLLQRRDWSAIVLAPMIMTPPVSLLLTSVAIVWKRHAG
jgi:hypothetical protein